MLNDKTTIVEIRVGAARTFNCPGEPYANEKPSIELVARIADGTDALEVADYLRQLAESHVEGQKQKRLAELAAANRKKKADQQQRNKPLVNLASLPSAKGGTNVAKG